jgi:hypothetical protein
MNLARMFHAATRRVRARGLQEWTCAFVGRVPSRGALLLFLLCLPASAQEPPVIPVGLDAYRLWELWPCQ